MGRIKTAIFGATAGFAAGFLGASCVEAVNYSGYMSTPAEATEDLNQAEASLATGQESVQATYAAIGEACLGVLSPYREGGVLYETAEDTIVNDLLAEPGLQCGETPSYVRQNVRSVFAADQELSSLNGSVTSAQNSLERAIENEETKPDANDAVRFGLGSAVTGLLVGASITPIKKRAASTITG